MIERKIALTLTCLTLMLQPVSVCAKENELPAVPLSTYADENELPAVPFEAETVEQIEIPVSDPTLEEMQKTLPEPPAVDLTDEDIIKEGQELDTTDGRSDYHDEQELDPADISKENPEDQPVISDTVELPQYPQEDAADAKEEDAAQKSDFSMPLWTVAAAVIVIIGIASISIFRFLH